MRAAALTVVMLLSAGCTRTHQFDPAPSVGTLPEHKLSGRTLVLDLSGVPESYNTSVDGTSFVITGIREHATAVTQRLFANDRIVDSAAEVALKLGLTLNLGSKFGGTECVVTARWEVLPTGQTPVTGEGEGRSGIPAMANGGPNCEIAALQAIAAGLDGALSKL